LKLSWKQQHDSSGRCNRQKRQTPLRPHRTQPHTASQENIQHLRDVVAEKNEAVMALSHWQAPTKCPHSAPLCFVRNGVPSHSGASGWPGDGQWPDANREGQHVWRTERAAEGCDTQPARSVRILGRAVRSADGVHRRFQFEERVLEKAKAECQEILLQKACTTHYAFNPNSNHCSVRVTLLSSSTLTRHPRWS
jgi:hypothetical protein